MSKSDSRSGGALQVVATAANEAEAELLMQRLAQAGIQATSERAIGGPEWGASGARYIYVPAGDLERARDLLRPREDLEGGR